MTFIFTHENRCIKVTPPSIGFFFKIQIIQKTFIPPSKASIGGAIKDILKIRTASSLQCCQILLKK